jgi:hypothetical protein
VLDSAIAYLKSHADSGTHPLLLDFLTNYSRTYFGKRNTDRGNTKLKAAGKEQFPALSLHLNASRGKLYERVFGEHLIRSHLNETYPGQSFTIEVDTRVFPVQFQDGRVLKRRADIYVPELGATVEIKSGRVSFDKHTRAEIEKDGVLLSNGTIQSCTWFLYYGATRRVLRELERQGIDYFDFEFGFDEPEPAE